MAWLLAAIGRDGLRSRRLVEAWSLMTSGWDDLDNPGNQQDNRLRLLSLS